MGKKPILGIGAVREPPLLFMILWGCVTEDRSSPEKPGMIFAPKDPLIFIGKTG